MFDYTENKNEKQIAGKQIVMKLKEIKIYILCQLNIVKTFDRKLTDLNCLGINCINTDLRLHGKHW